MNNPTNFPQTWAPLSTATLLALATIVAMTPSCNGPVELGPKTAKVPVAFIPNAGQTDSSVRFQARTLGGMAFFTTSGATLSLPKSQHMAPLRDPLAHRTRTGFVKNEPPEQRVATVSVKFVGAGVNTRVREGNALSGIANFLIGDDPNQWKTNLPTYAGIVYENLYPDIQIRFDGADDALKSTVDVEPGADPSLVRWFYEGAESTRIDESTGNLVVVVGKAEHDGKEGEDTLVEHAPVAWQLVGSEKVAVPVRFRLEPGGIVRYELGEYDHSRLLVIDPSITYSTFIGSKTLSNGRALAVGADNSVYVTGETSASTFPVTASVKDSTHNGGTDVFVTKLNADGTSLAYSTFLGGLGNDVAHDIAVDGAGNAWLVGATTGSWPLKSPIQGGKSGATEGFVAKLNPTGQDFVFSSYHGGNANDSVYAVTVDAAGNGYVTGNTTSTNFPVTGGAIALVSNGLSDAFVTKWSSNGARTYSTYLGGSSDDTGWGIAVSSTGDIVIAGETSSTNFGPVVLAPGYDASHNGGVDGFLVKFAGTTPTPTLQRATYMGASMEDVARDVVIDASGSVYVVGDTTSSTFPANLTLGSAGGRDVFVNKYASTLTSYSFSYRVAGTLDDWGRGIAVDTSGSVWLTGSTASASFAGPLLGYVSAGLAGTDMFLTRIVPGGIGGASVNRNCRIGGSGTDDASDIAIDTTGVYLAGSTTSANYPVGPGEVYRAISSSGTDVVVTKLNPSATGLLWSTYVTGETDDEGHAIAVQNSHAYVAGRTNSSGFVTTPGAATGSYSSGTYDAFVLKMSTATNELVYSTYLGGSGNDEAMGIAVDVGGNAVVVGQTDSANFGSINAPLPPVTPGFSEAFFVQLNATGSAFMTKFRFGGSHIDWATDVALDSANKAYIVGYTRSTDFLVQSALQPTNGGSWDAFVAKLDLTTTPPAWVYSTYLGGAGADYGWGIATDGSGNAVVTGQTTSQDFPHNAIGMPLQPMHAGGWDAFLTKYNGTGSMKEYSTYFGGTSDDIARDVTVDGNGTAYIVGETKSSDLLDTWFGLGFPVISGLLSGATDGFVMSVDSTGQIGQYATYFGGSGDDALYGVAVCSGTAQIAVTGQTASFDMLLAGGAVPQGSVQHGGKDALVARVDDSFGMWDFSFSSYLGGSADDVGRDIAIVQSGCQPVVTGYTKSSNFTSTGNAYDNTFNSDTDVFVTRFAP